MLSTKIRTAAVTLATVMAISGTTASLASAQAKDSGSADAATCQQWLQWYEEDLKRANEAVTGGKASQVTKSYEEAAYDLALAKGGQCAWATVVKKPHPSTPRTAPVTVVKAAHASL